VSLNFHHKIKKNCVSFPDIQQLVMRTVWNQVEFVPTLKQEDEQGATLGVLTSFGMLTCVVVDPPPPPPPDWLPPPPLPPNIMPWLPIPPCKKHHTLITYPPCKKHHTLFTPPCIIYHTLITYATLKETSPTDYPLLTVMNITTILITHP